VEVVTTLLVVNGLQQQQWSFQVKRLLSALFKPWTKLEEYNNNNKTKCSEKSYLFFFHLSNHINWLLSSR